MTNATNTIKTTTNNTTNTQEETIMTNATNTIKTTTNNTTNSTITTQEETIMTNTTNRNQKLLKSLSISYLKTEFPIFRIKKDGELVVDNRLQQAIDEGILTERLTESGNLFHGGDITGAVKAMKACVASYKVNYKKSTTPADAVIEEIRIETLTNFLNTFAKGTSRKVKYETVAITTGKAKWDVTDEEIEAMRGNFDALNSTYNCMASKLSKDLAEILSDKQFEATYKGFYSDSEYKAKFAENVAKRALRDRLYEQKDRVRDLRREAKNASKAAPMLTPSDALLAKINKGKNCLSKKDLAELQALLATGFGR